MLLLQENRQGVENFNKKVQAGHLINKQDLQAATGDVITVLYRQTGARFSTEIPLASVNNSSGTQK